jgi:hypothetical protein
LEEDERGRESLAAMNGAWGFLRSTKEPVWLMGWWTPELESADSGRCIAESKEERRGRGSGFPG